MGPAGQAGTLDSEELEQLVQDIGQPPAARASAADKKAYQDKLKLLIRQLVDKQTQDAKEQAQRTINTYAERVSKAAKQAVERHEDNQTAASAPGSNQEQRAKAMRTFRRMGS